MSKLIWKLRYAMHMRKRSGIAWEWCWHSAGESYNDLTSDGSIKDYHPINSADDEMSYWAD